VQVEDDGSATAEFAVPLDAELAPYVVVARCAEVGTLEVREGFQVTPPDEVLVPVPSVIGMALPEATKTLAGADLVVGTTSGTGVVTEQTPGPGVDVDPGSAVDLVLAPIPPVTVEVPSVVGLTEDEAEAVLVDAGLALGQVVGDTGKVFEQSPAAGVDVEKGRLVDIVLVAAPKKRVQVPDLRDRPVAEAQDLLVGLGLKLGIVGAGDVVRAQKPAPGTLVLPGSTVNVSVGGGPVERLVRVPDLTGLTLEEARRVLEAVGLVLFEGSPSEERVVSQQPAAKVRVPLGSTVTVTLDEPVVEDDDGFGPAVVGVIGVIVIGAATAAGVQWRQSADRRWLRDHLEVAGRPGPATRPGTTTDAGSVGLAQPVLQLRGVRDREARVDVSEVE
jgi:beta-lactam-binding protein with PASTA domain